MNFFSFIALPFLLLWSVKYVELNKVHLGPALEERTNHQIDSLYKREIIPDLKSIFLEKEQINPKVRFLDTSLNLSDKEIKTLYQEVYNSNIKLFKSGEISKDLNNKIHSVNQGFQEYLWYKRLVNTKEKTDPKDRSCIAILIRDGSSNTVRSQLLSQLLESYPDEWKQSAEWIELKRRLQTNNIIGASILSYSNIDLLTPKGTTTSLEKAFRSERKYTVFVFTASWCQPCQSNYDLFRKNFDQLQHKNTHLISYSLDKNYESWLKLANKENYIKACYNDNSSFSSKLVKGLGISSIPSYIVTDENGTILAKYNGLQLPDLFRFIDAEHSKVSSASTNFFSLSTK